MRNKPKPEDLRVAAALKELLAAADYHIRLMHQHMEHMQAAAAADAHSQAFIDKILPDTNRLMRHIGYPIYAVAFKLLDTGDIQIVLSAAGINKCEGSC